MEHLRDCLEIFGEDIKEDLKTILVDESKICIKREGVKCFITFTTNEVTLTNLN